MEYSNLIRCGILFVFLYCVSQSTYAQEIAFTVAEKDLIPEGIALDSVEGKFYLSSIYKNKIIEVSKGKATDFITSNTHGFIGGVGLHVDEKRRILWACSGNIMGNKFTTGLFAFDLKTKKLLKKVIYPINTLPRFFNDLVIARDGSVYVTDTFDHSIWKYNLSMDIPSKLMLSDSLPYPNGIEISPDNQFLISTSDKGLQRIDLKSGEMTLVQMPAQSIPSIGLDGIGWYENSIIGIQNHRNKSETKIVRYYLTEDCRAVEKAEVIDTGNKYFNVPTTLVISGNTLFVIANSQLDNLDQENLKILKPKELSKTKVLRYNLN